MFPFSFIFLFLLGIKNHPMFCLLSLLLSGYYWLIPNSNSTEKSLSALTCLEYSVYFFCLFFSFSFLPAEPCVLLIWIGLSLGLQSCSPHIPMAMPWEFSCLLCVCSSLATWIPCFLLSWFLLFLKNFYFGGCTFSSSFLRKTACKWIFEALHIWKCLSSTSHFIDSLNRHRILYWKWFSSRILRALFYYFLDFNVVVEMIVAILIPDQLQKFVFDLFKFPLWKLLGSFLYP